MFRIRVAGLFCSLAALVACSGIYPDPPGLEPRGGAPGAASTDGSPDSGADGGTLTSGSGLPDGGTDGGVALALEYVDFADHQPACTFGVRATLTYPADGGIASGPELFRSNLLFLYVDTGGWKRVSWPGLHEDGGASICDRTAIGRPFLLIDYSTLDASDTSGGAHGVAVEGIFHGAITIDLSHAALTRPNYWPTPLDPNTAVDVEVTGTSPTTWDSLLLYSPEIALEGMIGAPDGGSYSGLFDYPRWSWTPIDASQGDSTYVVQESQLTNDQGRLIVAVTAAAEVPGFSVVEGSTVPLRAELQPVPLIHSVSANIDQAAYADAGSRMSAIAPYEVGGETRVTPFPFGDQGSRVDLARGGFGSPEDLPYGDLVPGLPNELYVAYRSLFQITSEGVGWSLVSAELPLDTLPDPIAPVIWPVRDVQINGADATVAQTGVGASPVVSWSPPAFGQAAEYEVQIWLLDGGGFWSWGFPIYSGDTQVMLPPDSVLPGHTYAVGITAIASSSREWPGLPLMKMLPEHHAEFVTAPFSE